MENNVILATNKELKIESDYNNYLPLLRLWTSNESERVDFEFEIKKEFSDLDIDVFFGKGFVVSITFNEFSLDAPKFTVVGVIRDNKGIFRWIEGDRKEVDYRYYNEINESTPARIYDICNFINQYKSQMEKDYNVEFLGYSQHDIYALVYGDKSNFIYKFTGRKQLSEYSFTSGGKFMVFTKGNKVTKVVYDRETYKVEDLNKFFFKLRNSEMLKQLEPALKELGLSTK